MYVNLYILMTTAAVSVPVFVPPLPPQTKICVFNMYEYYIHIYNSSSTCMYSVQSNVFLFSISRFPPQGWKKLLYGLGSYHTYDMDLGRGEVYRMTRIFVHKHQFYIYTYITCTAVCPYYMYVPTTPAAAAAALLCTAVQQPVVYICSAV